MLDPSFRESLAVSTGISFPVKEDKTRQEFAAQSDVASLLRRFGGGVPLARLAYGAVDFDVDLVRARELDEQLHDAVGRLPEHILDKFGGVDGTIRAISEGRISRDDLKEPEEERPGSSVVPEPAPDKPAIAGASVASSNGTQQ